MTSQTISPAERDRLTTSLKQTRERLLRTVRSLSAEQLDHKPAPDRWSIAENVEHISIVESLILDRIVKLSKAPAGSSTQSNWQGRDDEVLALFQDRANRFKGPAVVMPTGQLLHEEVFRKFEETRDRVTEFAAATSADLRNSHIRHPVFGDLDCYQWLLGLAAHSDRHRAQIEEVMAGAGFPRAAAHA
jgi:hypothetical protein